MTQKDSKWAHNCIRKHTQRGFKKEITPARLIEIRNESIGKPCYFCGNLIEDSDRLNDPARYSVDIIDPHTKIIAEWNLRIICRGCNNAKGNLNDGEFLQKCKNILQRCNGASVYMSGCSY